LIARLTSLQLAWALSKKRKLALQRKDYELHQIIPPVYLFLLMIIIFSLESYMFLWNY
jgi:ABC-type proline/glycine betaine transport system permease subunit